MPVTGDVVTVSNLIASLTDDHIDPDTLTAALPDDVDPDTPVVVRIAGTEQLLWISEITLHLLQEHHRVDEETIVLPVKHVVLVAEPPRKRTGETGDDNGDSREHGK